MKAAILSKKDIDGLLASFSAKYGGEAVARGSYKRPSKVISTGVLELDYKLGTGGWTLGDLHVVYGSPDLGKSSSLGLASIRSAQEQGYNCAIVAMEPNFDPAWAERHGIDTERLIILRPETGEEAFEMLIDLVDSGVVDWILFDSIGAVIAASEMEADGKAKQGGQSGLITRGVKAVAPKAYRNECGVMFINQIRDNMKARVPGMVDMPGGHALKHACITRALLKPTANQYKAKIDGDDVVIGREIAVVVERNKQNEGSRQVAKFDFYQKSTDTNDLGIDRALDVINTAVATGVISRGGAYFTLPGELGLEKAIQGLPKVRAHFVQHPEHVAIVRELVLKTMKEKAS